MNACVCMFVCVFAYVCMHVCMYVWLCVCVYVCDRAMRYHNCTHADIWCKHHYHYSHMGWAQSLWWRCIACDHIQYCACLFVEDLCMCCAHTPACPDCAVFCMLVGASHPATSAYTRTHNTTHTYMHTHSPHIYTHADWHAGVHQYTHTGSHTYMRTHIQKHTCTYTY